MATLLIVKLPFFCYNYFILKLEVKYYETICCWL